MLNKTAFLFLKKFAFFSLVSLILGCANRIQPQGGPRDHDPPKLLKATPPNMTRNFKAKVIQLDFDEFFKPLIYSEITMSPAPTKVPDYKIRKKSIVITLRDSLEKNTTYVINFGKAIADVNEGNVLKNFTYVFATGSHIDSLSISGNVINTLTGEREKEATVMLFTLKQDSLLFGKKRPTIFTTTDTAGNFSMSNLHADDYRIYALKQPGTGNKIYNGDKDLIAFSKKVIHLTKDTSNIELKLFKAAPDKFRLVEQRFDLDGKMFFTFNKSLDNPSLKVTYPPDYDKYKIVDISKTKDTATLYMRNMDFDSIRVAFFDNNKPLDTIYKRKGRKESFIRILTFQYNINANSKLKPGTNLTLKASYPIQNFDPALVDLKEDSTDVTNFTLQKDTADSRLFTLLYRWKQNAGYTLLLNEDAFTDIYGDKNKRLSKRFDLDKPENYSLLTLNVTVPDTGKQYIVELLNEKKEVLRRDIVRKNTALLYKNYLTDKYGVRVVYDDNNNGKWDSGNVKLKLQPENIWVDPEIITLRPNWEQVTPVAIPKEPATP
ncbi:MAG TPA: Ig-like domain-containing protein [Mucilaginibacter sp.]|jgi:hypothetical protein